MNNVYKSIVVATVFGNAIAFPAVALTFPWDTYLIDPTPYYIVEAQTLGLLIAVCIFTYEWVKYGKKPSLFKMPAKKAKK